MGDLPVYTQSGPYGCWVSWKTSLSTHSQALIGAGLARRPPCLPQSGPYGCWVSSETSLSTHSQVLMGAGLDGRPPCLPHSQVLMGAGLDGRPPCLPQYVPLCGPGDRSSPLYPRHVVKGDQGFLFSGSFFVPSPLPE